MTGAPLIDVIKRRTMFALELIDKITGERVSDRLAVSVAGLPAPVVTPSRRFVWIDLEDPADRSVDVAIRSLDRRFADETVSCSLVANVDGTPASDLLQTHDLEPTGLYDPPPGLFAATGMVIEAAAQRTPVPALQVVAATPTGNSAYAALTDPRGGFVVAFPELVGLAADDPDADSFGGWLMLRRPQDGQPDEIRYSPALQFRPGRRLALPEPLAWAALTPNPPPVP